MLDEGIVYSDNKYCESNGIKVYTKTKTWSSERKDEYHLRRWEDVNVAAEAVREKE